MLNSKFMMDFNPGTDVPNIDQQLFINHLNPDITGTLGLFRKFALLSGKITQLMSDQSILYSDKEIEYTPEPIKLADHFEFTVENDNLKLQSQNEHSTGDEFNSRFLNTNYDITNNDSSKTINWVSRCGIFCNICEQKYPNKLDFDKHFAAKHTNTDIVYTCSLCNEEGKDYNRFRNHCYRHFVKGRITCSHCPEIRFTQEKHLLAHESLFHSKDGKSKNTKISNLITNPPIVSTNDIPVPSVPLITEDKIVIHCSKCKQCYVSKKFFHNHFQNKHPKSTIVYTCITCYEDFEEFETFIVHCIRQHDKFSCDECPLSFTTQKLLSKHVKSVHRQECETYSHYENDTDYKITAFTKNQEESKINNSNNIVQKSNSNVDIDICTNIDNSYIIKNSRDIFSSERETEICKQGDSHVFQLKDENSQCSQSVMSESDISDLISNMDTVTDMDSEINNWRNHIGILCGKCNEKFSLKNAFDDHYHKKHDSRTIYTCPLCKREYENYERFRGHCYRHFTQGRFQCHYCSHRFPKLYRLYTHIKAVHPETYFHFEDKATKNYASHRSPKIPPVDAECNGESRKPKVDRGHKHLQTWLSRYGIFCCKCKMKFLDKASFLSHYQEKHSQTDIVYTCSLCGQEYNTYKCFSNHCLRHFNRDSYRCRKCPKRYAKYRSLIRHMKEIHSGDNKETVTFACKFCNKIYLKQDRLIRHNLSPCYSDASSVSSISTFTKASCSPSKTDISCESYADTSLDTNFSYNSNTKSETFSLDRDGKMLTELYKNNHPNNSEEIYKLSCDEKRSNYMDGVPKENTKSFNWLSIYGILCIKCNQTFPGKNVFLSHYCEELPKCDVVYTCSVCLEQFQHYRAFISHGWRHFVKGRYKCQYCQIMFSHQRQLNTHIKVFMYFDKKHRDSKTETSVQCEENYNKSTQSHNDQEFFLEKSEDSMLADENHNHCNDKPKSVNVMHGSDLKSKSIWKRQKFIQMMKHKSFILKGNREKIILCRLCEVKFMYKRNFDAHFNNKHSGWYCVYTCPHCERSFNYYKQLYDHCCYASKRLRRQSLPPINNWIRHSILCGICDLKFISVILFREHYKQFHSECVILYSCSWCRKDFENYEQFRGHCYLHSAKGKVKCCFCPLSFTKHSKLVVHKKNVHSDNIPTEQLLNRVYAILPWYSKPDSRVQPECVAETNETVMTMTKETRQTLEGIEMKKNENMEENEYLEIPFKDEIKTEEYLLQDKMANQLLSSLVSKEKSNCSSSYGIVCGKCKLKFLTKAELEKHFGSVHTDCEVLYTCAVCDRDFKIYHSFRNHRYRHMGRFKCSVCPSRFSLQSGLMGHIVRQHSGEATNFMCPLCYKPYHTEPGLKLHIRARHTDQITRYPCKQCGIVLQSKNGYLRHLASHKRGMQYMCHICGRRFAQKINMLQHFRSAHREHQLQCHVCPWTFHTKADLLRHLKRHHLAEKKQCPVCERWYRNEYCLRKHSLTHTERCYPCDVCGKRFVTFAKLRQHTNVHQGLRPYSCSYCDMAFTNISNLLKHNKKRHYFVNCEKSAFDPKNVTENDPSLYDKNLVRMTASDDSTLSVITTSENLKSSVIIKKSKDVKGRNKDIVSCSKLSTDSSLELRIHCDTCSESALPLDKINLCDIQNGDFSTILPFQEYDTSHQNMFPNGSDMDKCDLVSLIDSLPMYWSDETNHKTNSNNGDQIKSLHEEIIKELVKNADEKSSKNVEVSDEFETEEILCRNLSNRENESSRRHSENNRAFEPSTTSTGPRTVDYLPRLGYAVPMSKNISEKRAALPQVMEFDPNSPMLHEDTQTASPIEGDTLTTNVNLSTSSLISNANDLMYSIVHEPDHTLHNHNVTLPQSDLRNPKYLDLYEPLYIADASVCFQIGSQNNVNQAMPN